MIDRQRDNRRRYNRLSKFYDATLQIGSLGTIGRMYQALADAVPPCPGGTLIEFGCGPGNVTPYLRPLVGDAGRIVGVDLSDGMIEKAQARAEREGWSNVRYERRDILDFESDKEADAVVFSLSLTAMPECGRSLERAWSILRPGGCMAILDSLPDPGHPFINWIIHRKAPHVGAVPTDEPIAFANEKLEDVGFERLSMGVYQILSGRKPLATV